MFTMVFLRSGGNLQKDQRGSSLTYYASRIGKDSLEHCESFTQMHLSTLFLRIRFEWMQVKAGLTRKIHRNVGKGWFSRIGYRARDWPFGLMVSHCSGVRDHRLADPRL